DTAIIADHDGVRMVELVYAVALRTVGDPSCPGHIVHAHDAIGAPVSHIDAVVVVYPDAGRIGELALPVAPRAVADPVRAVHVVYAHDAIVEAVHDIDTVVIADSDSRRAVELSHIGAKDAKVFLEARVRRQKRPPVDLQVKLEGHADAVFVSVYVIKIKGRDPVEAGVSDIDTFHPAAQHIDGQWTAGHLCPRIVHRHARCDMRGSDACRRHPANGILHRVDCRDAGCVGSPAQLLGGDENDVAVRISGGRRYRGALDSTLVQSQIKRAEGQSDRNDGAVHAQGNGGCLARLNVERHGACRLRGAGSVGIGIGCGRRRQRAEGQVRETDGRGVPRRRTRDELGGVDVSILQDGDLDALGSQRDHAAAAGTVGPSDGKAGPSSSRSAGQLMARSAAACQQAAEQTQDEYAYAELHFAPPFY